MSLYKISTRGVLARSLYKISIRGLLARLSKRSLYKLSIRALLARSVQETSWQDSGKIPLQDLYKSSLCKISAQALYKRPPCQDLCARSPWASKLAPCHNESDLTRPKCREGCASTCYRCSQNIADNTKSKHWKTKKKNYLGLSHFLLRCWGLQSIAPATKNEPEASEVLHLPHGIIIMPQVKFDDSFRERVFKTFPTSNKYCVRTKNDFQTHLIFTHACQRFSNVQKTPRLPRGWKSARCPAPVTQKGVSDFKMSRECHACQLKWT